ncbi:hypothetical protein Pcinc_044414 [Petrolisthes cinctipes]|uniref:Uncharacterized protein n=1 Tax=Petrolisthes cinctipes TaxID=88211 RepID=A0AAE1BE06_PETCI|nr:hypothetical protein Pcinc_044414 [Petrolisthes cinctipes]
MNLDFMKNESSASEFLVEVEDDGGRCQVGDGLPLSISTQAPLSSPIHPLAPSSLLLSALPPQLDLTLHHNKPPPPPPPPPPPLHHSRWKWLTRKAKQYQTNSKPPTHHLA